MLSKVIFFTLLHSLWIGLVVAIICGIILVSSKKSTPHFRYNLLSACLTLFTLGIISAAWYEYSIAAASIEISGLNLYWRDMDNIIPTFFSPEKNSVYENIIQGLSDWKQSLLSYSYPILWIWSIVMSYKVFQLFRSMQHINKLKKTGLLALEEQLLLKSEKLRSQFKINAAVKLFYSSMAAVPQVIGWLKPVVLIPIGLINHLSPDQIEAVIAHELAHIKRRDYIVNCLQYVLEIFFFFNPFLLWLSYKIKEEREHCCDDLVMVTNYRKKDYIKALIVCSEYEAYTPVQALTLIKGKNQLLKRVTRLLTNQNLTFNNMEKIVLICLSLFMISFASLYGTKIKELPVIEYLSDKINEFQSDTTKPDKVEHKIKIEKNTITTNAKGEKKEEKIVIDTSFIVEGDENGSLFMGGENFIIDGDKFIFLDAEKDHPFFKFEGGNWDKFPKMQGLGFESMSEDQKKEIEKSMKMAEKFTMENGMLLKKQMHELDGQIYKEMKSHSKELEKQMKQLKELNDHHIYINGEELNRNLGQLDRLKELDIDIDIPDVRVYTTYPDSYNYNYNYDYNRAKEKQHKYQKEEKRAREREAQALGREFNRHNGEGGYFMENPPMRIMIGDQRLEQIKNQLIKDRIISAGALRSISLDEDSFVVNGVIQSKKVHKKYKKMFLKENDDEIRTSFM